MSNKPLHPHPERDHSFPDNRGSGRAAAGPEVRVIATRPIHTSELNPSERQFLESLRTLGFGRVERSRFATVGSSLSRRRQSSVP
jgi:hypothetical protein